MIKYFKQEQSYCTVVETNSIKNSDWVYVLAPSDDDIEFLGQELKLSEDILRKSLDVEGRSRIDLKNDYIFVMINASYQSETGEFSTLPIGIFITDKYLVTILIKENSAINQCIAQSLNFDIKHKLNFLLNMMYEISKQFLKNIRQIIKSFESIEDKLFHANKNADIIKIMYLQKGLTFFSTDLYSNDLVISRIMKFNEKQHKHKLLYFDDLDEELLDDVYTENKQALEMVGTYSLILTNMMDIFASMIANNQNTFLKILAIITFLLTIPMILSGLWGMNVNIPFKDTVFGFWFISGLSFALISFSLIFLWFKRWLK
ncbi:magnesium transporter CorA family protein [Rickettsiales bacterium LUAb2]